MSIYQDINKVVQWAVADSKSFSSEIDIDEDFDGSIEELAEEASESRDFETRSFKDLYTTVYSTCLATYLLLASNED